MLPLNPNQTFRIPSELKTNFAIYYTKCGEKSSSFGFTFNYEH